MYTFTDPYQQASYQHVGYPAFTPYVYNYSTPSYDTHMPRESTGGYLDSEKDRKRPAHIFPQNSTLQQQPYTKQMEEPIDSRYFHVERYTGTKYPAESWESTDYSRKVTYRHYSGQHRDRHSYDHKRTTQVYHTNPGESALKPSQHGAGKYLVRREE
ncbi:hypothetical protein BGX38DRAFT_1146901 [Terfezia claveryi]|nr:hypothetical protein BGX38DRAFT_1146901 [Terfezia claveryi]